MKRFSYLASIAALVIGSTVVGQALIAQPAGGYSFSDIALYSSKTSDRYGVFIGEPQAVLLGNQRLELTKPSTVALNGLIIPRSLAVNGSNNLRLDAKPLSVYEGKFVADKIQIKTKKNLQSVYYFDGAKWFTVGKNLKANDSIQFAPTPRASAFGAGMLTSDEALALNKYLAPKGELLLATLAETDVTETRVNLSPAPTTYRRSVLAVQYGVPKTTAPAPTMTTPPATPTTPVTPPTTPVTPPTLPSTPPTTVDVPPTTPIITTPPAPPATPAFTVTPTTSLTVPIIKTLPSNGIASYNGITPLTRFDTNNTEFLETWKMVSGNQIPAPVAPKIDFAKHCIITVFWGQKNTGGYSIAYKSASLDGNILKLVIETRSPAAGSLTTQVITSPYVMLEVASTAFDAVEVKFESN